MGKSLVNVQKLNDFVSVKDFGAKGDGVTDDSSAISLALSSSQHVIIPSGFTFLCKNVVVNSNNTLGVFGTLKMPSASSDGDKILSASSASNITIYGSGVFDGNAAGQSGAIQQRWIDFLTCSKVKIYGPTFKKNYCPTSNGAGVTCYALHISSGSYNSVSNVRLEDWGREGIYLDECSFSEVSGVIATDNDGNSWSAVQVSGTTSTKNRIQGITTYNTGASAVGLDSTYSSVSDIIADTVRFQNGVNLGHASKPASYSTVSNVVVKNLTDNVNANSAGLSIVNGTTGVSVTNLVVDGSTQRGVNISASGANVQIKNARLKGCLTAISMYQAGRVDIDGLILEGTNTTGILKDQGASSYTTLSLSNADITSSTTKITGDATGLAAPYVRYRDVLFDNTASTESGTSIAALGAGGTVTVTNANARAVSAITLEPSNTAGANAVPFISTYNDGSFVITTVNSGAGGAFVRWRIV